MSDTLVLTIAQAILANTKVLQTLVETLPKATQQAVAEKVAVAPVPVAAVPVPVAAVPVAAAPVAAAPVAAAPVPAAPVAAVPVPDAPVPAAPVAATPVAPAGSAPFTDQKGLVAYVMGAYKAFGPEKGKRIGDVLVACQCQNINDVKPEQYDALFAGIEALK